MLARPLADLRRRLTPRGGAAIGSKFERPQGGTRTSEGRAPGRQAAVDITAINRTNYGNPHLVREYLSETLRPAEVSIFMKYRDDIVGRRVVDIGCGAGRLLRYFRRWTPYCTGIDFSPAMVAHCRRTFPELQFAECDARDVSQFPEGAFDFAVFSFNGIDTLGHEDRLASLATLRTRLSANGLYVFSSHNRRYRHARQGPSIHFSLNPATLARRTLQFGRSVANRRTRKPWEREEAEYTIINDLAHEYVMLHYYIDRDEQAAQLARVGFTLLETYGEDGEALKPGDDDSASAELYYVARRVSTTAPVVSALN